MADPLPTLRQVFEKQVAEMEKLVASLVAERRKLGSNGPLRASDGVIVAANVRLASSRSLLAKEKRKEAK